MVHTSNKIQILCLMKKAVALFIAFAFGMLASDSSAKKISKEEQKALDTVSVTLKDGTTINGVIKKYWTSQYGNSYNKEFSLTDNSDKEVKIKSEDLDSIVFPMRADSLLKVWRVYNFPAIKLFGKKGNIERWIAADGKRSKHARIVVPNVRVNRPIGTRSEWVVTTWGCLQVENDTIAHPFFFNFSGGFNLNYLKKELGKTNPDLVNHIEAWFKADKKRKKAVEKDYAVMLEAVEDYYTTKI